MEMTWSKSENIADLVAALAQAQLEFDPVLKDSENPAFRSKYADLATVIESTRKHLAKKGISIIQMPHAKFGVDDAKEMILTTLMAHASGQWIATDLSLPAMMRERFDAQAVGSAITYARRYALAAMVGVAQEDDDGNKAAGMGTKEAAQAVATEKLKKAAKGDESVSIVEWKENQVALTGNGLAIVRANLTEAEKNQLNVQFDRNGNCYVIKASDGHLFASFAERCKVQVKWENPA